MHISCPPNSIEPGCLQGGVEDLELVITRTELLLDAEQYNEALQQARRGVQLMPGTPLPRVAGELTMQLFEVLMQPGSSLRESTWKRRHTTWCQPPARMGPSYVALCQALIALNVTPAAEELPLPVLGIPKTVIGHRPALIGC